MLNLVTGRFGSITLGTGAVGTGTLLLASVAALGLAYIVPGGAAAPVGDATVSQAVPRTAPVWRIADDMSGSTCDVRRGPRITGGTHAVELGEDCAAVHTPLTEAAVWTENRDGTVSFGDASGRLLVVFAPSDGRQMEAVEPRNVMMSLQRR